MIERFQGEDGIARLTEALRSQKMLSGDVDLIEAVIKSSDLVQFSPGELLIEQGASTNDVFLVLAGTCRIIVNGRSIAVRGPGDHVGEMAAIEPTQERSASVMAESIVVALKISDVSLRKLGGSHSSIYREIARELARRLMQRNSTVGSYREKIRVFIICSVEALGVARLIENAFEHDPFTVEKWTEGCFKVSNYTLEDLEAAVDNSDFAIAIAHSDDEVISRKQDWPAPRDNVIFELGLFMGRLGRRRAILMEPRGENVKLPSDLTGIKTIPYRYEKGGNNAVLMSVACNHLRDHIMSLGPNNG